MQVTAFRRPVRVLFLASPLVTLAACDGDSTAVQQPAPTPIEQLQTINSPASLKQSAAYQALSAGNLPVALTLFEELIALEPDNLPALTNRAVLLSALGRHADALVAIEACAQRAPDDIEVQINRGTILRELRRFEESLEALDRAIAALGSAVGELTFKAKLQRALVLLELSRGDEALAAIDAMAQQFPDRGLQFAVTRAQCLDRLGRRAEADALWEQLRQQLPNDMNLQAAIQARPPANQ